MTTGAVNIRTMAVGAMAALMLAIAPAAQADTTVVTYVNPGVCNEASHSPKGKDWQVFAAADGDHTGGNLQAVGRGVSPTVAQHSRALAVCGTPVTVTSPSGSSGGGLIDPFAGGSANV